MQETLLNIRNIWRRILTSPAWRQNSVLIGLTLIYAGVVYIVAEVNSYQDSFNLGIYWSIALKTILYTALFMGFVGLLHLVLIKRPARPLTLLAKNVMAYFSDIDRLLNVALVIVTIPVVASLYTSFKTMIPALVPFYLDQAFMEIDRAVHFGYDPWRLTHALFGGPAVTVFINLVYHLWFFFLWGFLLYSAFFNKNLKQRMQYMIGFVLTWMVLGSLAAVALSSAGPVYYAVVTGLASPFASLMDGLRAMDAELRTTGDFSRVWALDVQDRLWNIYANSKAGVGAGISAMPSLHLATTALMTFHAFQLNRWLGWFMTAFLIVMLVGSVHLGWHYAIDGYVAIPLAYGLWRLSGWAVRKTF